MTQLSTQCITKQFQLTGLVQGQGVRPMIVRLANRFGISGRVWNTASGVDIIASGTLLQVDSFEQELRCQYTTTITKVGKYSEESEFDINDGKASFIIASSSDIGIIKTEVPLDLATCSECMAEFNDPSDRRYRYPFLCCTTCGPRYSIVTRMPFDRNNTAMAKFPMCEACQSEYCDVNDRRFHAQTITCSDCGPQCWATDSKGDLIAKDVVAMEVIADYIRRGKIVVVLGLGGYQLICDATNDSTIRELRRRKRRPMKPLSVMFSDIESVRRRVVISDTEAIILSSLANPIVLLRCKATGDVSYEVAPELNTLGVFLPTTPIHAYLQSLAGIPLVVTSGNIHGSPLLNHVSEAQEKLASVGDVFLHHNRPIVRPVDDSVVQCVEGSTMTIRGGRGFAPMQFDLPGNATTIAVGGHQKVTIACGSDRGVLSPHIGDMSSEESRLRFEESVSGLSKLYEMPSSALVHDKHSEYFTTNWAKHHHDRCHSVQHHHAHVAAAMLEHGLLNETVLGIAFDGTGLGDDGSIWGGEILMSTRRSFQRVGHLLPFVLPGGEWAVKQPWRTAMSILSQLDQTDAVTEVTKVFDCPSPFLNRITSSKADCSSVGRLFDAIAAIVLGIKEVSFEGEAAMRLEAKCDLNELGAYRLDIVQGTRWQLDWRPMLTQILKERKSITAGRIAMRFHRAVANAVVDIAQRYRWLPCVITGGVFQNRTLLELIVRESKARGLAMRLPGRIPINDGGLALGQLVVACSERSADTCV